MVIKLTYNWNWYGTPFRENMDRVLLNTSGRHLCSSHRGQMSLELCVSDGFLVWNHQMDWFFVWQKRLNLQNYIRLLLLLAWLKKRQSGYSPVFCHVWFINQPSKITHAFPRSYPWPWPLPIVPSEIGNSADKISCAQFCRLNQGESPMFGEIITSLFHHAGACRYLRFSRSKLLASTSAKRSEAVAFYGIELIKMEIKKNSKMGMFIPNRDCDLTYQNWDFYNFL